MELYTDLNILLAALAAMALGALWYSPLMFQSVWVKLSRIDLSDPFVQRKMRREASLSYLSSFVSLIVMATMLGTVMFLLQAEGWQEGVLLGIAMWIGFVATTSFVNYSFSMRPYKLWALDSGYHLLSLILMGIMLSF